MEQSVEDPPPIHRLCGGNISINSYHTESRVRFWSDVSEEKWRDWRWQLSNSIKDVEGIKRVFDIRESEGRLKILEKSAQIRITPYLIALMDVDDSDDPIRKQFFYIYI